MKFFSNCKDKTELKKQMRILSKKYHPDCGGDPEVFKQLSVEYDRLYKILPEKSDRTETAGTDYQPEHEADFGSLSEALREAVNAVAGLSGVTVELCGRWIWVSGETYSVKEILKANGYKFSRKKKMWYFHEAEEVTPRYGKRREADMSTIRAKYGSESVKGNRACLT